MSADATGGRAPTCQCGHAENVHVPFPACGDLGWYGCTQCEVPGFPTESGRCLFFRAVPHSGPPPIDHGGDDPYGLQRESPE